VATTGPTALGLLTDIASEIILHRGEDGRNRLWPLISAQYELWCIGKGSAHHSWYPCEALIRISCNEMHRFSSRLANAMPALSQNDRTAWSSTIVTMFANIASRCVDIQSVTRTNLVTSKQQTLRQRRESRDSDISTEDLHHLETPFGAGHRVDEQIRTYPTTIGISFNVPFEEIRLDFGATLYRPVPSSSEAHISQRIPGEIDGKKISFCQLSSLAQTDSALSLSSQTLLDIPGACDESSGSDSILSSTILASKY
jgi:hypothetical protein